MIKIDSVKPVSVLPLYKNDQGDLAISQHLVVFGGSFLTWF